MVVFLGVLKLHFKLKDSLGQWGFLNFVEFNWDFAQEVLLLIIILSHLSG